MIKLEAFTPVDGWALARDDLGLWLTKPPYLLAARRPMAEKAAVNMIIQEIFTPADEDFSCWTTLVQALIERRAQAAGPDVDAQVRRAAEHALARCSAEELARHLDTIETCLIPAGYQKESAEALKALLQFTAPVLGDHPDLLHRLACLLERCISQTEG